MRYGSFTVIENCAIRKLWYWYSKSVCPYVRPSVCLSVRDVPVSDKNGLTYCHSFFVPFIYSCVLSSVFYTINEWMTYGRPIILVLSASNTFTKFRRGHPCGGAKYWWGIKISWFSTNKSLYLANDTRYSHSYYGRRIGTRGDLSNGAISNDLEPCFQGHTTLWR